jgi:hypothetical protein
LALEPAIAGTFGRRFETSGRRVIVQPALDVAGQTRPGTANHTRGALKVRTGVKAAGLGTANHTRGALKVRTAVKAGGLSLSNHNRSLLR